MGGLSDIEGFRATQAEREAGPSFLALLTQGFAATAAMSSAGQGDSRDQATAALERCAECGLLPDRLGPGVEHPDADGGVRGPRRHQPPLQEHAFTSFGGVADGEHLLRRGDVVARLDARHVVELEVFRYLFG